MWMAHHQNFQAKNAVATENLPYLLLGECTTQKRAIPSRLFSFVSFTEACELNSTHFNCPYSLIVLQCFIAFVQYELLVVYLSGLAAARTSPFQQFTLSVALLIVGSSAGSAEDSNSVYNSAEGAALNNNGSGGSPNRSPPATAPKPRPKPAAATPPQPPPAEYYSGT